MNFDQLIIREFLKLNPGFTDTPRLIAQKRVGSKCTGAVNFPKTEEAKLTGSELYSANIPSLKALFRNITPNIEIYKPLTNRDVAKVLFEKYGVIAEVKEIVDTKISYDPLPLNVTLVAVNGGLSITDSVKVDLTQKVMDLTEIITATEYSAVEDLYPSAGEERFIPIKHYYGADCTEWRDKLKSTPIVTSSFDPSSSTVSMFLEILNDPRWNCPITWDRSTQTDRSPYTLYGCRTPYNGSTTGYQGANIGYTHVLVINAPYATGIVPRTLLLHYNWRP